jgi:glycosyltransferase involved in cell wall biosynthesis
MKNILWLAPESILPPKHGGSLRSYNLIAGLSQYFHIKTLVPQNAESLREVIDQYQISQSIDWIPVEKHPAYLFRSISEKIKMHYRNWRHSKNLKMWNGVFRDWYFAPLVTWYPILESLSRNFTPQFVVIEHTRHAATLLFARKLWPKAKIIANSHNVESVLLRQNAGQDRKTAAYLKRVEDYERKTLSQFDLLWTCSDDDLLKYQKIGVNPKKPSVLPNGVDLRKFAISERRELAEKPTIIFTGTLCYEPNIQGIQWFYSFVWPLIKSRIPEVQLHLVGLSPAEEVLSLANLDKDIYIFPNVPDVQPYLSRSHVGICPLLSGSGTRLKILEAFAAGLPMVSTRIGVEGICAENSKHILIVDDAIQFANGVVYLLENPEEANKMRASARKLAEERYDWEIIVKNAALDLRQL